MKKLINLLFGHKYYLNIINDGECDYICSTIFSTLTAARQHRQSLSGNRSVEYVGRITFRTRRRLQPRALN